MLTRTNDFECSTNVVLPFVSGCAILVCGNGFSMLVHFAVFFVGACRVCVRTLDVTLVKFQVLRFAHHQTGSPTPERNNKSNDFEKSQGSSRGP